MQREEARGPDSSFVHQKIVHLFTHSFTSVFGHLLGVIFMLGAGC